jgi:hypothetical protein
MFNRLNFNLLKFFCVRQSEVALAYRVTVTRAVDDAGRSDEEERRS